MLNSTVQSGAVPRKKLKLASVWAGSKPVTAGMLLVLAVLTCLPIYNIIHIIATTGANNLSNDYALFLPLIDKILGGHYAWVNFFNDTFFVSHFQPLPILVYLANALITGWNVYAELFFVVLLSIIRLILTYQVLSSQLLGKSRFLLLPILAALIFSNSQLSAFEFGASAVPLGLTAFGFALGVWGLVRLKPGAGALAIMALGGLVASWTAASGIIAWLIFLAGMILIGYRKLRHYLVWLAAAMVINFPYFYFLVLYRQQGTNALFRSLLDMRLVVNLLGRPFANGIASTTAFLPLGEAAGWMGLLLGCLGLALVIAHRKELLRAATPALMFMAFGLLCAWQTSVYRVMIAPWYTNMVIPYWIGLASLAIMLLVGGLMRATAGRVEQGACIISQALYSISAVTIISGFYLATNLTYRDKSFYLVSRSPVSASCLRNYEWAPTYCERTVFQWTVNRVSLGDFAWPLQHNRLNVFSRHQVWSMQGDMILGNVYSPQAPGSPGVTWVYSLYGQPAVFTDYHHLDLSVSAARSVVWRVQLPDNLSSAEFRSAIRLVADPRSSAVSFEIYIGAAGVADQLVFAQTLDVSQTGWHPFSIDLLAYQGQEITIRLAVDSHNLDAISLFQFPQIDLVEKLSQTLAERPLILPINTELSSAAPRFQTSDIIFDLDSSSRIGMQPVGGSTRSWKVEADPSLSIRLPSSVDLRDYGWLSFTESASADISNRAAVIFFYFDGQSRPVQIVIPLLADAGTHTYTYPLRLLDFSGKFSALEFQPILYPSSDGPNIVTLADMRLIHLP